MHEQRGRVLGLSLRRNGARGTGTDRQRRKRGLLRVGESLVVSLVLPLFLSLVVPLAMGDRNDAHAADRKGKRPGASKAATASGTAGASVDGTARTRGEATAKVRSEAAARHVAGSAGVVDPIERARARETLLRGRAAVMEERARAQALATYRLARRRETEVLANGRRAAETARALEAALVVFRRSAWETAALRKEVGHATRERAALEKALAPGAALGRPNDSQDRETVAVVGESGRVDGPGEQPTAAAVTADVTATTTTATTSSTGGAAREAVVATPPLGPLALPWPVRGTIVSGPGQRRDPATGTESLAAGIEILSRMNEPAVAVAAGKVTIVEALPQGGHAIVITHPEGRTSLTTGLRITSVRPGDDVTAGQNIGFVGRDLDGAPVVTFELWQAGTPLDPRPYLTPEN
jgi:murein DD-endopeptidase MepM/ murein hydrolase activator NlpD